MKNSAKYRVFVCTKQRRPDAPAGCCYHRGAIEIYQAFQKEIKQRQLEHQVEIRQSGCLDRCQSGVVVSVHELKRHELPWLSVVNKNLYCHVVDIDIPAIVDNHFVHG